MFLEFTEVHSYFSHGLCGRRGLLGLERLYVEQISQLLMRSSSSAFNLGQKIMSRACLLHFSIPRCAECTGLRMCGRMEVGTMTLLSLKSMPWCMIISSRMVWHVEKCRILTKAIHEGERAESDSVVCWNSFSFVSVMGRVCRMLMSYWLNSNSSAWAVSGVLESASAISSSLPGL